MRDLFSIGPVKQTISAENCGHFLITLNMCCWCSKEPSQDGSFEYPKHMVWVRNRKISFSYTLLSGGLFSEWD